MKGFLRSKPVLILTALVMLAGAIAIPLSVNIMHSHAASATTADNGKPPLPRDQKPTSIDDAVHLGKIDDATVRSLRASGHADVLVTVRYADVLPGARGRRGTHADVVA